ncbi:hypothetical protein, partial [Bacillus licheniformis]
FYKQSESMKRVGTFCYINEAAVLSFWTMAIQAFHKRILAESIPEEPAGMDNIPETVILKKRSKRRIS